MPAKSKKQLPRGVFRNPSPSGLRYGVQWFHNKKRHRVLVSDSLAEAVRWRKDIKALQRAQELGLIPIGQGTNQGTSAPPSTQCEITFDEYADRFLAQYESSPRKTYEKYRGAIRSFQAFLLAKKRRKTRLCDVSTAMINDFIRWRLNTPLAETQPFRRKNSRRKKAPEPSTVRGNIIILRTLFNAARKEGLIAESPTKNAKLPKVKKKLHPRLSREELKRFFAECDEYWFPIFYCLATTGLRCGAVCQLQVGDIDFDRGVILQYEKRIGSELKWAPKGNVQEVPVAKSLLRILRKAVKGKRRSDLVFPRIHGKTPHKTDDVWREFKKITASIGRPDVTRTHSLRKLFSRILLDEGVDLSRVSELLGHSDPRTTMVYTGALPRELSEAVSVFNKVLGDAIPESFRGEEECSSE